MLNYQKLDYDRYYVMNEHGDTRPCSRCECFAAEEQLLGCQFRQRWFYDHEAGYAIRLPRNNIGDALGRRNGADLKSEERHYTRRMSQVSIDQPVGFDDENESMDFVDENACVEQIIEDMDTLARLTKLLAQLSENERELIHLLLCKSKKSDIASRFNTTVDAIRYRELKLRKKLSKNLDFQRILNNF